MEHQSSSNSDNYEHLADLLHSCYKEYYESLQVTNGLLMLCLIRSMKDTFKNRKFKAAIRKRFENVRHNWGFILTFKGMIDTIYLIDSSKTFSNRQARKHISLFINSIFK